MRPYRDRIVAVATAAVAISVVAVVLYFLQFSSPALVDVDGYFHIKYSYMMSHGEGMIWKLPWLNFTIHRDFYRDHHFLQHLLQIPFTFGDLRLGAKYAAWCFATLAFAAFYLTAALRGRVVAAILTVALLGAGNHFLYRLMMPRVPAMSMALVLLIIWLIASKRDRWLAVAMFGFVWLYDGFILGLIAVGAMVLGDLLAHGRFNRRALGWALAGMAAGILINPYFPHNLESLAFNLTRTVSDAQLSVPDTGWEWKPLDTYYWLRKFWVTWAALGLGVILTALGPRTRGATLGSLLLAVLMTVLMMKARRYSEIWPPLVFLFLAYAWADFWDDWQLRHAGRVLQLRQVATATLAGLVLFIPANYRSTLEMIDGDTAYHHFEGAAGYLREHADPQTVVYNVDWDDFPFLFYFNSDNYYVVGLDQLYMRRYDPALYEVWRAIRDGEVHRPSRLIWDLFGAEYVVVNLGDESQHRFYNRGRSDPAMQTVYNDERCAVLRIARGPREAWSAERPSSGDRRAGG